MTDISALMAAAADMRNDPNRSRTHWEGCFSQHPYCLIGALADEIERLRGWQQRALRHLVTLDEIGDEFGMESAEVSRLIVEARVESQPDAALLREAVMLLFDWDALIGGSGSVATETRAFLDKVGYDPMTATMRPADHQNGGAS